MSRDIFDSAVGRLDPSLAEKLRGAFNTVQDRMQANHLVPEEGWTLGWNHIGDPATMGSERYLFMPVRQSGGKVVEARRDLSVTVVLV